MVKSLSHQSHENLSSCIKGDPVLSVVINEHEFFLRAQKSLFWPKHKMLLLADTHFAKDAVFRQHGIQIPGGTCDRNLQRLEQEINETGAEHVVVLGDFIHGKIDSDHDFYLRFNTWRVGLPHVKFTVLLGNHDRYLSESSINHVDFLDELLVDGFVLTHEPDPDARGYVLAGHIHPVANLSDGVDRMRLPVFWFSKQVGVLPAFGEFTGGYAVKPAANDRLFGVGEGVVRLR